MRTSLSKTFSIGLALAALLSSASLNAQQQKATVGKIVFDALPSPQINVIKDKKFTPKDWLEAEAEITIPPANAEQKKIGFIDQVTVKWYIAVKGVEGAKGFVKLTKDITHINVPVDEPFFSSVYISPNLFKRLTGKDRASKDALEVVGLEVLINGVVSGAGTSEKTVGWWTAASLSDMSSKFPLLNKNETPFKMLWYDRFAEISEDKR
jgi:hypothetical protein